MKTIQQFKSINSFSTKRLLAEKLQASDLDKFRTMHNNAEVMRTLGGIRDEKQTVENLNWNLKQWDDNGFGLWMFYLKDTKEWIGRGGIRRVQVNGNSEVEIGYALMPSYWHQGFATEITEACLEIAFEVVRLNNVVSFTLTTNKASQRVMEKSGFQYESDITHANFPHVLYRIQNPRKVEVVPYNPNWINYFENESKQIEKILGNHLKKIHHIGSTSIPNMPAKPVIDIMLECENLDDIALIEEQLNTLNYYNLRRSVIPHRSFFIRKQDQEVSYHLHIRERGDPQVKRHVNFRDYVSNHPEDAKAYAELKLNLAKQFPDDINSYVFGKDKLVQAIDRKAKLWEARKHDFLSQNTGSNIRNWSQDKLVKAMEANLNVQMTHFSQYVNQIYLIRIPGYTIVKSGLMDDTFNYVLEADFTKNDADNKIKEVMQYFAADKIPFSWWASPYDKPGDLAERLQAAGLINSANHFGMYLNLDNWQPIENKSNLKIVRVTEQKGLHDFANLITNNESASNQYYSWVAEIHTNDDPIEFYVGYINDKPVARGQLVYFAQVAGIYSISTLADERGNGYHTTIRDFLQQRAKENGYHIAFMQASKEELPSLLNLDFKECCVFKEFK